jgi:hypothetical protein
MKYVLTKFSTEVTSERLLNFLGVVTLYEAKNAIAEGADLLLDSVGRLGRCLLLHRLGLCPAGRRLEIRLGEWLD